MVIVATGDCAAYPFGALDEQGRHTGADTLLLWHVARELAGRELARWTWGLPSRTAAAIRSSSTSAACHRRCTTSICSAQHSRTPHQRLLSGRALPLAASIARLRACPSRCVCRCVRGSDARGDCCDTPPRIDALRTPQGRGVFARVDPSDEDDAPAGYTFTELTPRDFELRARERARRLARFERVWRTAIAVPDSATQKGAS